MFEKIRRGSIAPFLKRKTMDSGILAGQIPKINVGLISMILLAKKH